MASSVLLKKEVTLEAKFRLLFFGGVGVLQLFEKKNSFSLMLYIPQIIK